MVADRPYTIIDKVSIPQGAGHCREQLVRRYGATSAFLRHEHQSFQVYTYDGRYFIIEQTFAKRRGQLFDCHLCEVTLNPGVHFPHEVNHAAE